MRYIAALAILILLTGCAGLPSFRKPVVDYQRVVCPASLPEVPCPDFDLNEYNAAEMLALPLELRLQHAANQHYACAEWRRIAEESWRACKARE